MSNDENFAPATRLIHAGRRPEWTHGVVNPPVYHASTCIFDTLAEMDARVRDPSSGLYYGRRGTPTQWALEEALTQMEPGAGGTKLFPSGLAAVAGALLAVMKCGDHLLMVDSVYEPTRTLCDRRLKALGIETTYYAPGADIAPLLRPNTRAVFTESPGSLTFEVQDIPALAEAAHKAGALVLMDNTWATSLYFKALPHGVDVMVQALTKYVVGHSDALLGAATTTPELWKDFAAAVHNFGYCAAPDDAMLALRGLRTLDVRLARHHANGFAVARWLEGHPEVARVLHPALPGAPGHALWQRDFSGASGLFAMQLRRGERADLAALVDGLKLFKMGFSWGGYESLILPVRLAGIRTADPWPDEGGPLVRLHIGLEDPADLIADLDAGLQRYSAAVT